MNALRLDGPLQNLSAMSRYCAANSEGTFENGEIYGYITESERYRYCLRLIPWQGDYNGYIYVYDKLHQELNKSQHPDETQALDMTLGGM